MIPWDSGFTHCSSVHVVLCESARRDDGRLWEETESLGNGVMTCTSVYLPLSLNTHISTRMRWFCATKYMALLVKSQLQLPRSPSLLVSWSMRLG